MCDLRMSKRRTLIELHALSGAQVPGDWVDNFETVRRHKDGSLIDVSLTISPIWGAEGKVVGAVKTVRVLLSASETEERQFRPSELRSPARTDMTHHEELIALAKGIGLFTDEGREALVSYMRRQEEEHSERLQAIRKLSEIGD
jgi:hypothetical protein